MSCSHIPRIIGELSFNLEEKRDATGTEYQFILPSRNESDSEPGGWLVLIRSSFLIHLWLDTGCIFLINFCDVTEEMLTGCAAFSKICSWLLSSYNFGLLSLIILW